MCRFHCTKACPKRWDVNANCLSRPVVNDPVRQIMKVKANTVHIRWSQWNGHISRNNVNVKMQPLEFDYCDTGRNLSANAKVAMLRLPFVNELILPSCVAVWEILCKACSAPASAARVHHSTIKFPLVVGGLFLLRRRLNDRNVLQACSKHSAWAGTVDSCQMREIGIIKLVRSVLPSHFDNLRTHFFKSFCKLAFIFVGIIFTKASDELSDCLISPEGREMFFCIAFCEPRVPSDHKQCTCSGGYSPCLLACVRRSACQQNLCQYCSTRMAPNLGSACLLWATHASRIWHLDGVTQLVICKSTVINIANCIQQFVP